jgi:uncharacterized membrane protein
MENRDAPEPARAVPGEMPSEATRREKNPLRRFLKMLGPGLITGAADDDPSGIGTYTAAGASFDFATLWTAILTLPMMAVVQYICAKIGMVSGMGLAGVLRKHYSRKLLYPAVLGLLVANTINAGTDIGAIAAALNLFVPIPITWMIVPIALIIVALQLWGSYRLIARLQVAHADALRLHRRGLSRQAPLGRGAARHLRPATEHARRLPAYAGRHPRDDHLALPLLLAGQRGGRGGDQHGSQDSARA